MNPESGHRKWVLRVVLRTGGVFRTHYWDSSSFTVNFRSATTFPTYAAAVTQAAALVEMFPHYVAQLRIVGRKAA